MDQHHDNGHHFDPTGARRALNAAGAQGDTALRAFCFAIPAGADQAPPEWVQYLPAPDAQGRVIGVDGRTWTVKDPQALVDGITRKLAFDINHSSELAAPKGGESPAAAWADKSRFQVRDDKSIWVKPDWTKRGLNAVQDRDYGFFSPAFDHNKAGVILRLVGGGLTNEPNFTQLALNRAGAHSREENPMLEQILAALGFKADAKPEDVLAAIGNQKLELTRATNAAANPPVDKFVPKADHDVVVQRAINAEKKLSERDKADHDKAVDAEIKGALQAGQITPATEPHFRATCASAEGLESFRQFRIKAPKLLPEQIVPAKPAPGTETSELTEAQRAICARTGVSEKDYLAQLNLKA